jgi:hypothetical protein
MTAEGRITLGRHPSDQDLRAAVATWIDQMARGDYTAAVAAVFRKPPPPDAFREHIETFESSLEARRHEVVEALKTTTGRDVHAAMPSIEARAARTRVVPASEELLQGVEIHREGIPDDADAWLGFHVPLESGFGIWTTMGVIASGDRCLLQFEIFHL